MRIKSCALRFAVMVFSAGWVGPLFALLIIPAEMVNMEAYWATRMMVAERNLAELEKPGVDARKDAVESAKMDFALAQKYRSMYPDRQREQLGYYQTSAIILCVWLGLVIAFWAWQMFPTSCKQSSTLS